MTTQGRPFKISALFLFALAVIAVLSIRYQTINFISGSLWAEDGPVFYEQAVQMGLRSLVEPYAGYLHIYPRVFALLSLTTSIQLIPYAFFSGWLLALFVLWWGTKQILGDRRVDVAFSAAVVLLCLLQPHRGETLLSLTNAQWWLAPVLAMVIAMPDRFSHKSIPLIMVLSLTGPFSIILMPLALFQGVRTRHWKILSPIFIGGIIQSFFLAATTRSQQTLDTNIESWITAARIFLTFGSYSPIIITCASAIWISAAYLIVRGGWSYRVIMLCGLATYAAALYTMKGMPQEISPVGSGSRYFVIPYALLVIGAAIAYRTNKAVSVSSLVMIAAIFMLSYWPAQQALLNYQSFAKLARYEKQLTIPIAPVFSGSPGYSIRTISSGISQEPSNAIYANGLFLLSGNICEGSRHVGIAADVSMSKEGDVSALWSDIGSEETDKFSRYYPAGPQRIQMAFKKSKRSKAISIELPEGSTVLGDVKIYCM